MGARWILACVLLSGCFFFNEGDGDDVGPRPDARRYEDAPIDACIPKTCEALGANCGDIADDGCGGTLMCGTCAVPSTCGGQGVDNVCAIPTAERTCVGGWCWESPSPVPFTPSSVFATAQNDVWAVGEDGIVLHYDGTKWSLVPSNTTAALYDIWMAGPNDGWLVGSGGTIRRWNGSTWTTVTSGTTATLRGVYGLAANDVWIVGDGVSRRWAGTTLTTPIATATPSMLDVFVASASGVFAVGEGRVWRYTGTTWASQTAGPPTFTTYSLSHIAGTATSAFAVGREYSLGSGEELIYRWDGATTWTKTSHPGDPEFTDAFTDGGTVYGVTDESIISLPAFERVVGPGPTMYAAAGATGARFVMTFDGQPWRGLAGTWTPSFYGSRSHMTSIGAVGDGVWFTSGQVTEWRGGLVEHDPYGTDSAIVAVAGTARDNVWVADAIDYVYHFDGTSWTRTGGASFADTVALHADAQGVTLVGEGGVYYPSEQGNFQEQAVASVPADVVWHAADDFGGDLYIAGNAGASPYGGRVARRTNGTWTELPAPSVEVVCGIAVVAHDDIWVVGNDGAASMPVAKVSHYNGQTWTTVTRPGATKLCAVEAYGGELFTSGLPEGDLHRRAANGTWTVEQPLPRGAIHALRATATDLWLAGDHGAVLRR